MTRIHTNLPQCSDRPLSNQWRAGLPEGSQTVMVQASPAATRRNLKNLEKAWPRRFESATGSVLMIRPRCNYCSDSGELSLRGSHTLANATDTEGLRMLRSKLVPVASCLRTQTRAITVRSGRSSQFLSLPYDTFNLNLELPVPVYSFKLPYYTRTNYRVTPPY